MSYAEKIAKVIMQYERGVYTPVEMYVLLVRITPEEHTQELLDKLPKAHISEFKKWLFDYPLHGGGFVGSGEGFEVPKNVLLKLRELMETK